MTRRRWIADEISGDHAAVTGLNADHLARVLRASVGQEFEISTGTVVRLGRIVNVDNGRVEFELGALVESQTVRPIKVVMAVFKFDRFEWALEKCTELGATEIVPVLSRRTDAHLASAAHKRVDRWRRIVHEASQQSRRAAPPRIADPVKLRDYLDSDSTSMRIVLSENEDHIQLREVLAGDVELALAIGPEGGWTEEELRLFSASGWKPASLGPTILRAETAAIAAVAIAAALSDTHTQ